eukprot:4064842-Pleurochrysis_carterae.AAC.2
MESRGRTETKQAMPIEIPAEWPFSTHQRRQLLHELWHGHGGHGLGEERLDGDVGHAEGQSDGARQYERLARDVDAAEVVARVRLSVAQILGAADDDAERLALLQRAHHVAQRPGEGARDVVHWVRRGHYAPKRRHHGNPSANL